MDEVLDQLQSTKIRSTLEENVTTFDGLYKNWGRLGNQNQRRLDILEIQKSNRYDKLDRSRGIFDLVNNAEKQDVFKRSNPTEYRPSIYVAGFNKVAPSYKNVLMMSEWMVEKPEDFETNWLVLPCPKGTRMLVVASNGKTKFYTKFGQFRFECRTGLPGGNPCGPTKNQCCVLDGFYDKQFNKFFIVDLLAWNNQPMTDGETEFRHYWLESQLQEITTLKVINKKNEIIFSIVPKVQCDKESLQSFMLKYPHFDDAAIDGLLFYHKQAHYFAGETPLVGWLYPFMVPEVIGQDIKINKAYEIEKPLDYTCQSDFIRKFEIKSAKRQVRCKERLRNLNSSMDTSDSARTEDEETGEAVVEPNSTETMELTDEKTNIMFFGK